MLRHISPAEIIQQAFPGIRKEEAEEMASSGDVHTYPSPHMLCREGSVEEVFYIILSGEVKVTKVINEVDVRVLSLLKRGDFFGEMAIVEKKARMATVRALGQARVLTVDKKNFLRRIHEDPSLAFRIVQTMSHRIRELGAEVAQLRGGE